MDEKKGRLMKIEWKGTAFKGNAELCYREIQTLGEDYTPDDILNLARNESTELHKCFDWDDASAAEKWRKHTARLICCSLSVIVEKEEHDPVTYRIIQHNNEKKAYAPVTLTVRNDDEYARLIKQAKAELAAFRLRYKSIVELETVIDEIDRFING